VPRRKESKLSALTCGSMGGDPEPLTKPSSDDAKPAGRSSDTR
jgi:hypothetical protein